jgi:hypothetical protein
MRTTILALLAAIFAVSTHASSEDETTGEWSAQHQHLKARFVATYHSSSLDGTSGGPYSEFLVYLELWNTSPTLSTALLKLDIDPGTNITYRVTDGSGREVNPGPPAFRSTFDPGVYNLVLPPDSHLRFPVSRNGAGVFEDKTKLDVGKVLQGTWYFDRGIRSEFKLSGTLHVPEQPGRRQPVWWDGKLDIPPVSLLVPDRNAQQDSAATQSQPVRQGTNQASSAAGSGR